MPENATQTCNENDGVTKQDVHSSHQSGWMAHWMSSNSCKSTTKPACGRLSICYESQGEDKHDPEQRHVVGEGSEKAGNASEECEKRSSGIAETKLVRFTDEKLRSSFPMFNLQRKGDDVLPRKNEQPSSSHWESKKPRTEHEDTQYQLCSLGRNEKDLKDLPPILQWVHVAKNPSRENAFKAEHVSRYHEEGIDESSKLAMESSIKGEFMVSSSKVVPYGINFGKSIGGSARKQEESNRSNSILESGHQAKNAVYHSCSKYLAHDKSVCYPFERSRNQLVTCNDAQLLPRDPSASRSQQPEFVAKQCLKIQELSGKRLLPGLEKHSGCLLLPSPPCHTGDMEAVRTLTTVDSIEESSRVRRNFSTSTSHHFLFAKTDFNLAEGPMLRESMVSTKLKEQYSTDTFHLDQDIAFPVKSGVKLQLLGSSTGSEGEKDAEEFKTSSVNIRNESSSETNTMDVDTFMKNRVSGVVSSSLNKHVELEHQTPTAQNVVDSARDIIGPLQKRKFPDINEQPSDLAACPSSADTSTSRTQSLDAEHLLSYAEQPTIKCDPIPTGPLNLETSRWVKRLKKSPMRSSQIGEDSSREKVNSIFGKLMKFSMTGSDPIAGRFHHKEPTGLSQRAILLNPKTLSTNPMRRDREVMLSHQWIRRLCQNAGTSYSEKSKAVEASESQRSKSSTDKSSEKKQFPSLAAMALMGKALGGNHRTCQFKRKGSSVVWSS